MSDHLDQSSETTTPDDQEPMSPVALRKKLLDRAAPLLDQYIDAAYGIDSIESIDSHFREEVWSLLKKFIEGADDKIILPEHLRGGPSKIIEAVETGHITLEEGERLLVMYRIVKQIEMEGMNPDTVNQTYIPQVNINTLPAGGENGKQ